MSLTILNLNHRRMMMTKDEALFIVGIVCGVALIVGIIVLGIVKAREED